MKLSEFSVRHSLLVNLISVFILIAGFYTVFIYQIKKEAFPDVSFDKMLIQTIYPGAPSEEIEKLVTVPLEKELKGIDGIEKMNSTSTQDLSTIVVSISQDVKSKSKVVDDVQQAVDRVSDLPEEAEDPIVTELTSGEMPVVEVALSGQMSEQQLQHYAELLEDIYEDVPGVSSIRRIGWRDTQLWVEADPQKLKDYHVSIDEIINALRKRNVTIPGGKIRGKQEYTIRTTGEFHQPEQIEEVIIRANDSGNWLKIKDVATVRFAFEEEEIINKSRGTRAIFLIIIKRSSGDTIKIVDEVKHKTTQFLEQAPDSLQISYIDDLSYYIKRRLEVLRNNGIIGLLLVSVVLVIFLDARVALLTALGIPIAFSATISIMGLTGLSVNLITMFGLIVVLGMLVDDGIIVAENCSRYLESGLSPQEAAIKGTSEVLKPVTTTILTTIAAFSPLLFLEGMVGKFVWGIPVVVIIALVVSLGEAVIILPSHFADFVRVSQQGRRLTKKETRWFNNLIKAYTKIVQGALQYRYWIIAVFLVLFIATAFVGKKMPFILFGSQGIEQFYIRAQAPIGTNIVVTNELVKQIEEKVSGLPDNELEAFTTQVGQTGKSWIFDPYGKLGSHHAQVTVYVTPSKNRTRTVDEIIESLRQEFVNIQGFERVYFEKEQEGPPVGKPVAVKIRGEEYPVLEKISGRIESFLNGITGVLDVVSDYEKGKPELRVNVDEAAAARTFISVTDIAATVRAAFKGAIATTIKPTKAEEEIDVLVRFPEEKRTLRETFNDIMITNKLGNLIPLTQVAKLEEKTAFSAISHLDGKRVVTVRADVDKINITSLEANKKLAEVFPEIEREYPGYSITLGGEQEENEKSARSFLNAFVLAFLLIFMILAANFNSLVQPFIVMMAIPFGLIGVIWAFYFHGLPISFFMMMGVVGLIGIVVNDSIVLVEFINNLRRQGIDRRNSIIQGGQLRLRPVLLTTITTAFGLAPTAYGIWGNDPFLRPMALTIVWGIVCATGLTLIIIPCIYAVIDDIKVKGDVH